MLNKLRKEFKTLIFIILPILIYVVWTWPLVLNLNESIYSDYFGDNVGTLLYKFDGRIEYFFEVILLLAGLIFDNVTSSNILIFTSFLLTFYLGYFLIKEITKNYWISLLGAFLLTIAPLRLWYSFEWFAHANWGFLLGYLFFLIRFFKDKSIRNALFSGLFYGLAFFNHPYQGVMLLFITVPIFIWSVIEGRKSLKSLKSKVGKWLVFGGFCLVFALPSLYFLFVPNPSTQTQSIVQGAAERSPQDKWAFSARPWHYFIPDINHPVFGDVAVDIHHKIWSSTPYYLTEVFFPKEHTLFLGYTLMFLSLFIVYFYLIKPFFYKYISKKKIKNLKFKIKNWEENVFYTKFFIVVGITAFIFSLPPYMTLEGLKVYFPSNFIYDYLPHFRAYARFGIFVVISNVILAMMGYHYLIKNLKLKIKNSEQITLKLKMLFLVIVIIPFIVLFEFLNFPPFHNLSTKPPEAYEWLGEKEGDFSYLEIPTQRHYTDLLYSKEHGKRPLNAYYSTPSDVDPINADYDVLFDSQYVCSIKDKYNVKYIFYHKQKPEPLKLQLARSWGQPVWGTHAAVGEELKAKQRELESLEENLLRKDLVAGSLYTKVKDFENILVFDIDCD